MRIWMTLLCGAVVALTLLAASAPPTRADDATPAAGAPASTAAVVAAEAMACAIGHACAVATGDYLVLPPSGWNHVDKLTAALWIHGYQQSAEEVASDADLVATFGRRGVAMIIPNGRGKSWSFWGSPEQGRDEFGFIDSVLDDVAKHYPIDPAKTWATGFSIGGSMVWNLACARPNLFAGFVAFSGAFWMPYPERCAAGRVDLLHIHGNGDTTVPIAGRPIGKRARQGDAMVGLDFWRNEKHCPATQPAPIAASAMAMSCTAAVGCDEGGAIAYCEHGGGHWVDPHWVDMAIDWIEARSAARAQAQ